MFNPFIIMTASHLPSLWFTGFGSIGQINPSSPDIKMHILLTVLHTYLMEIQPTCSKENLSKYQDI